MRGGSSSFMFDKGKINIVVVLGLPGGGGITAKANYFSSGYSGFKNYEDMFNKSTSCAVFLKLADGITRSWIAGGLLPYLNKYYKNMHFPLDYSTFVQSNLDVVCQSYNRIDCEKCYWTESSHLNLFARPRGYKWQNAEGVCGPSANPQMQLQLQVAA